MDTHPNESVYPISASIRGQDHEPAQDGLTKREYFAAMALQGLLAGTDVLANAHAARMAVAAADHLINELNINDEEIKKYADDAITGASGPIM